MPTSRQAESVPNLPSGDVRTRQKDACAAIGALRAAHARAPAPDTGIAMQSRAGPMAGPSAAIARTGVPAPPAPPPLPILPIVEVLWYGRDPFFMIYYGGMRFQGEPWIIDIQYQP